MLAGFIIVVSIILCYCMQNNDKLIANHIEACSWAEMTLKGLTLKRKDAQLNCTDKSGGYLPNDLWYDHVVTRISAEEGAIKAPEAGHDVLLRPRDQISALKAVAEVPHSGRISMEQIGTSVFMILYYKALICLHMERYVDDSKIGECVGTTEHTNMVAEVGMVAKSMS